MKLIDPNWDPNDRQLRQFGIICLFALPGIAWLWGASQSTVLVLAGVGASLACLGLVRPPWLKPLFLGLMLVAMPIGLVIGELAMLLIYFGMFFPMAIAFRVLKRDVLKRSIDRERESYWQPKKQPSNVASYYRQS